MTNTPRAMTGAAKSAGAIDWGAEMAAHERWLRAVIWARTGEAQAVDEVFQEVALASIKHNPVLATSAKVAPWLYRLAVRQSLLYRRRMGRRRKLTDRYIQSGLPGRDDDPARDPLEWLLVDERRGKIRAALARLRRVDGEILLLKYIDNWSYQEIANHLGVSESAVEARLHRARRALRQELAALEVIEVST